MITIVDDNFNFMRRGFIITPDWFSDKCFAIKKSLLNDPQGIFKSKESLETHLRKVMGEKEFEVTELKNSRVDALFLVCH